MKELFKQKTIYYWGSPYIDDKSVNIFVEKIKNYLGKDYFVEHDSQRGFNNWLIGSNTWNKEKTKEINQKYGIKLEDNEWVFYEK